MKILKKYVVRIDSQKIENFSSNLKSYYRNSDWTTIGSYDGNKSPEGFKKVQGLFADDAHFNAIYAAGDPYDNQYVTFEDPKTKKSVVVFSKENETKIKNYKSYVSVFEKKGFKKLPSGEYFSKKPSKPIDQIEITNPVKYMQDQGWIVQFVDDIHETIKELNENNLEWNGENIEYSLVSPVRDKPELDKPETKSSPVVPEIGVPELDKPEKEKTKEKKSKSKLKPINKEKPEKSNIDKIVRNLTKQNKSKYHSAGMSFSEDLKTISRSLLSKAFGIDNTKITEKINDSEEDESSNDKNPLITNISTKKATRVTKGDAVANVLSKMYGALLKESEDRKKRDELTRNFKKEKEEEQKRFLEELVDKLRGKKESSKTAKKEEPKQEESGGSLLGGIIASIVEIVGDILGALDLKSIAGKLAKGLASLSRMAMSAARSSIPFLRGMGAAISTSALGALGTIAGVGVGAYLSLKENEEARNDPNHPLHDLIIQGDKKREERGANRRNAIRGQAQAAENSAKKQQEEKNNSPNKPITPEMHAKKLQESDDKRAAALINPAAGETLPSPSEFSKMNESVSGKENKSAVTSTPAPKEEPKAKTETAQQIGDTALKEGNREFTNAEATKYAAAENLKEADKVASGKNTTVTHADTGDKIDKKDSSGNVIMDSDSDIPVLTPVSEKSKEVPSADPVSDTSTDKRLQSSSAELDNKEKQLSGTTNLLVNSPSTNIINSGGGGRVIIEQLTGVRTNDSTLKKIHMQNYRSI